jgi:hypothetical protein
LTVDEVGYLVGESGQATGTIVGGEAWSGNGPPLLAKVGSKGFEFGGGVVESVDENDGIFNHIGGNDVEYLFSNTGMLAWVSARFGDGRDRPNPSL